MQMKTFDPKVVSYPWMFKTFLGAVGPRPIAFASTIDSKGKPNLAPFSFFNAFGVNPTTLIFSPSRRGRDNTVKNTFENVKEVSEVVINVVTYSMVEQTSLASTEYEKGVNEFTKAGFTAVPSETVKPARVAESPVQFECRVREVIETGSGGGAANLVVCEVTRLHIDESLLDEQNMIDQTKIDLVGRMGGDYYVRAHGDALFKVQKPSGNPGMGIDGLPEPIRYSHILTGNHLGKLGNLSAFPAKDELVKIREDSRVKEIISGEHDAVQTETEIHRYAAELLDSGKITEAFAALMAVHS